jgi:hypothetical protein
MKTIPNITPLSAALLVLSLGSSQLARGDSEKDVEHLKIAKGQVFSESIGQGINLTPSSGAQFGYFSHVTGLDTLFAGTTENETTALFTFYQEFPIQRVAVNGPLRVVTREGTTTVYLNAAPGGNFSNPDSFRAGAPIQTSVVRQQVVIDTVTSVFTVVNQDTITSTSVFSINGGKYQLGKVGDVLRTTRTGHLNSPGLSPAGWFAGYSVGAEKSKKNQ